MADFFRLIELKKRIAELEAEFDEVKTAVKQELINSEVSSIAIEDNIISLSKRPVKHYYYDEIDEKAISALKQRIEDEKIALLIASGDKYMLLQQEIDEIELKKRSLESAILDIQQSALLELLYAELADLEESAKDNVKVIDKFNITIRKAIKKDE